MYTRRFSRHKPKTPYTNKVSVPNLNHILELESGAEVSVQRADCISASSFVVSRRMGESYDFTKDRFDELVQLL